MLKLRENRDLAGASLAKRSARCAESLSSTPVMLKAGCRTTQHENCQIRYEGVSMRSQQAVVEIQPDQLRSYPHSGNVRTSGLDKRFRVARQFARQPSFQSPQLRVSRATILLRHKSKRAPHQASAGLANIPCGAKTKAVLKKFSQTQGVQQASGMHDPSGQWLGPRRWGCRFRPNRRRVSAWSVGSTCVRQPTTSLCLIPRILCSRFLRDFPANGRRVIAYTGALSRRDIFNPELMMRPCLTETTFGRQPTSSLCLIPRVWCSRLPVAALRGFKALKVASEFRATVSDTFCSRLLGAALRTQESLPKLLHVIVFSTSRRDN